MPIFHLLLIKFWLPHGCQLVVLWMCTFVCTLSKYVYAPHLHKQECFYSLYFFLASSSKKSATLGARRSLNLTWQDWMLEVYELFGVHSYKLLWRRWPSKNEGCSLLVISRKYKIMQVKYVGLPVTTCKKVSKIYWTFVNVNTLLNNIHVTHTGE